MIFLVITKAIYVHYKKKIENTDKQERENINVYNPNHK